ncbi:hypothetical protein D3OALGA1CA_3955 [Olavius algarvensis associated proteobacterium Delta 3]|nr:hypothetical protein D3OALGA1CA_3955 [Olavius algarvensis associated proteobacterium Delta 3]
MSKFPNVKLDQCAQIFKSFSNENRLKLFMCLASCSKPGTVGYFDTDSSALVGEFVDNLSVAR